MSFEQIREERRSAADLLSLMSFFNPQGIPESVLRNYSMNTRPELIVMRTRTIATSTTT